MELLSLGNVLRDSRYRYKVATTYPLRTCWKRNVNVPSFFAEGSKAGAIKHVSDSH